MDPNEKSTRATRSILDLGPRARVAFAAAYVAIMATVIGSAPLRPDHVFGFQMFNESSKVDIHIARRVRGSRGSVPAIDGVWQARDRKGNLHTFRWNDRVKDPVLGVLGTPVHAKYGLEGQLFRLKLAVADVAAHIPEDAETTALIAVVSTLKNGRNPARVRIEVARP